MVRAGEGAKWIEDFAEHQVVAIGWHELGEVDVGGSREEITERAAKQWPNHSKSKLASGVGQIFRCLNEFKKGDGVVSYDPSRRVYLIGTIEGDPEYKPELFEDLPRVRAVQWKGEVSRDNLSVTTRNGLGSISTLFQLSPEAVGEILQVHEGNVASEGVGTEEEVDDTEELTRDRWSSSRTGSVAYRGRKCRSSLQAYCGRSVTRHGFLQLDQIGGKTSSLPLMVLASSSRVSSSR